MDGDDEAVALGRRGLTIAALGSLLVGGCDRVAGNPTVQGWLGSASRLSLLIQHWLAGDALAREYSEADITGSFKGNGTVDPDDDDYQAHAANGFAEWKLQVDGLVARPGQYSLADLRAMKARTQITRHDCVEGWSCIGKWKGVPLAEILERVEPKAAARFAVFHCADPMENGNPATKYYESIDLIEAVHPQTILAYEMNDAVLPVAHGAPLRLRVERQLGYKMAKYVMRIEFVEDFRSIGGGRGGYWEDQGYAWYAGI